MRWLAILAILIAGAAGYLLWTMKDAATAPVRDRPARTVDTAKPEPEPAPVAEATKPAPPVVKPTSPAPAVAQPKPTPLDRVAAALDNKSGTANDATIEEEVEWTEEQRWQNLWAITGRFEKGNYPGAIEKAMEVARRYPPWQEDAWKTAIKAHCAMSEPDKAKALFVKMTAQDAIDEVVKYCAEENVKLAK